jgi:hypothetical protein
MAAEALGQYTLPVSCFTALGTATARSTKPPAAGIWEQVAGRGSAGLGARQFKPCTHHPAGGGALGPPALWARLVRGPGARFPRHAPAGQGAVTTLEPMLSTRLTLPLSSQKVWKQEDWGVTDVVEVPTLEVRVLWMS